MKSKASPDFQATLEVCGISYEQWLSVQALASKENIPGVKRARAIVKRVQAVHLLRTELTRLTRKERHGHGNTYRASFLYA
jgi:hypothetical protein